MRDRSARRDLKALFPGHLAAVADQPWTTPAGDDIVLEGAECSMAFSLAWHAT
jgi:hypothetical protein